MKDDAHRRLQDKVTRAKLPAEGTRLWHQRQQILAAMGTSFHAEYKEARARYTEDVKLRKIAEKGRA